MYNWWLLSYKEPETKITKFCFLDLGIGIFDSLEKKYNENALSALFKSLINPTDNSATLKKIFSGEYYLVYEAYHKIWKRKVFLKIPQKNFQRNHQKKKNQRETIPFPSKLAP